MNDLAAGTLAGFMATFPMTLVMEQSHEQLPGWQRYPLPPRLITMRSAHQAGICHELSEKERLAATLAAHFAVGTTAGAVYGQLSRHLPGPSALTGAAFGLGVWAGNYFAILPALGLLAPPTQQPTKRVALMIAAHLVWGAATGLLVGALRKRSSRNQAKRVNDTCRNRVGISQDRIAESLLTY